MQSQQTVKIFLTEGNPTGLRSLELFNWNGKGFIIPRDRVDEALRRSELDTQGVYILIGENEDEKQKVYVGESESLSTRIRSHHKQKDFWEIAICFFSKDKNLNKAHVKFLEEQLIKDVKDAGRVALENGNQPQQTRLSESDEAEVLIFLDNIKLILSAVGYTFLKKPTEYENKVGDLFVCKGPGAQANGFYSSEGMVVLKGSFAKKEIAESVKDRYLKIRSRLLLDGSLIDLNEYSYVFTKDFVFPSPSSAAQNVLARNANGWTEWKRKSDGKTLDEVYRQI